MQFNKKKRIEVTVMTILFLIAAFFVYKTTITVRMVMPRTETRISADSGNYYQLQDNDHLEQTFLYDSDELLCVGTRISLNETVLKDLVSNKEDHDLGTIHIEILDNSNQTSLMSADYAVYLLEDGQNLLASFLERQVGWENKELKLVLDASDIREEVELSIGMTEDANSSLSLNGTESESDINIITGGHQFLYWKYWAVFGAALIYLLLLGTYFGLAVCRLRAEQVFLFTGTILAVIYLILIPPLAVPDEEVHFEEAYYYVNVLQGREQTEDVIVMDKEDFNGMQKFATTPSLSEYDTLKEEIGRSGRTEGTVEVPRFDTQAPVITYLPGMIGIILGRLLGLNGVLVIYLGRIFSIACYVFMMYWFIRLMPFAKPFAFLVAILPMTIQQCCSYSYDSIVIEVAFIYLAVFLQLLYKDKAIAKWQVVLYVISMVMLSICKGGTYMPLCLLTLLIPVSRFKDKKQKWFFVGSMALIAIVSFLSGTLSYVLYVAAPTAEQAADTYLAGESYGASGLLKDPLTFLCLSVRTMFLSGDGFLETMLGMQLGWLNIFVSRIVIYGMFLLMILAVLPQEKREHEVVTTAHKLSYAFVILCSIGMVFASMFMSWTPKNSTEIAGIQGRYFLPVLPIFVLLFSSENVKIQKDISRKAMFLGVCLQCVAIYGILLSLERVL